MTCFKTTIVLSKTKNKQQSTTAFLFGRSQFCLGEAKRKRTLVLRIRKERSENGSNGSKQRSRASWSKMILKRGWLAPSSSSSSSSPFLPFQKLFDFVWLYPSFIHRPDNQAAQKDTPSTRVPYRSDEQYRRKHQVV